MANNRNRGHIYERKMATLLREYYPACKTTRDDNVSLDKYAIDLTNTGYFAIQLKKTLQVPSFKKIFEVMKEGVKRSTWNPQCRATIWQKGNGNLIKSSVVVIPMEDFLILVADLDR